METRETREKVERMAWLAAYERDAPNLARALALGANPKRVNMDGESLLGRAAASGSVATVKLLIDAGARLDYKDHDGLSAAHIAAKRGAPEVLEALLSAGAPTYGLDRAGLSVATLAAAGCDLGRQECLRVLARFGVDLEALDGHASTPLMTAAAQKFGARGVRCLLALGVSVDRRGGLHGSTTAAAVAAQNGNAESLALLIEAGASLDEGEHGPRHLAAKGGHAECLAMIEAAMISRATSAEASPKAPPRL